MNWRYSSSVKPKFHQNKIKNKYTNKTHSHKPNTWGSRYLKTITLKIPYYIQIHALARYYHKGVNLFLWTVFPDFVLSWYIWDFHDFQVYPLLQLYLFCIDMNPIELVRTQLSQWDSCKKFYHTQQWCHRLFSVACTKTCSSRTWKNQLRC
jgi:hypothetical protein